MSIAEAPTPAGAPSADPPVEHFAMKRSDRIINLVSIIIPLVGLVAAIVLLWNTFVGWTDLALMLGFYLLTGMGITVGYHRLFTHRSFQTYKPIEYAFAICGEMAVQGQVDHWVADHRKHHAHTDKEGDPHSPHVGQEGGWRGAMKGLYHAHMGWLHTEHGAAARATYARDLLDDPGIQRISRAFPWIVTAGLLLPFALGWLISGSIWGGVTGFVWGGLVRIALLHHVTFSINSICHFFGRRRFATDDESTNVAWLSLLSFGESWHHNHHAFPRSFAHGLRWWERALDPGSWMIATMEKLGLAWNVTRISPERQAQKLAA